MMQTSSPDVGSGGVSQRWRLLASWILAQLKYIRLTKKQRHKLSPELQEATRDRLRGVEAARLCDLLSEQAAELLEL